MQILRINDYTNREQIMSILKMMWRNIFFLCQRFLVLVETNMHLSLVKIEIIMYDNAKYFQNFVT